MLCEKGILVFPSLPGAQFLKQYLAHTRPLAKENPRHRMSEEQSEVHRRDSRGLLATLPSALRGRNGRKD
jgi:hypothetical protein